MTAPNAHTLVENLIRAVQQDGQKGTGWAKERDAVLAAIGEWDAICSGCGGTRRQHWGHAMCSMFTPNPPSGA